MRSSVCPVSSGSASSSSPSSPQLLPWAVLLHPHPLKHILNLLILPPRVRFLNSFGKTPKIPPLWGASLVLAPDSSGCIATHTPQGQLLASFTHILGAPIAVLCRPRAEWRRDPGQPRAFSSSEHRWSEWWPQASARVKAPLTQCYR